MAELVQNMARLGSIFVPHAAAPAEADTALVTRWWHCGAQVRTTTTSAATTVTDARNTMTVGVTMTTAVTGTMTPTIVMMTKEAETAIIYIKCH